MKRTYGSVSSTPGFTKPNIEERLTSAAFEILTDEHHHSGSAQAWAVRFLNIAAHGRPTAFQRKVRLSVDTCAFVRERNNCAPSNVRAQEPRWTA